MAKNKYSIISRTTLLEASHDVFSLPRQRKMITLHEPSDAVQRMVNVVQPQAYIRPHRHVSPDKSETFMVLSGSVGLYIFEEDGAIDECLVLGSTSDVMVADVLPPTWHTYIALEPDTWVFEAKQGPYDPVSDKEWPAWAPEEGSPEARKYHEWLKSCVSGE